MTGVPNDLRGLDHIDRELLTLLEADGRMPNNALAERVGIAPSTCLTRIRRLREIGAIRGFHADVDPAWIGRPIQAMIAVRIRSGHRARRLGVLGLPPEARLYRVMDIHRHTSTIPPGGIVLSAKLAEVLGVAVGDRVRVEVLEGRRRTDELSVVGLVDDFAGVSAYMSLAASFANRNCPAQVYANTGEGHAIHSRPTSPVRATTPLLTAIFLTIVLPHGPT